MNKQEGVVMSSAQSSTFTHIMLVEHATYVLGDTDAAAQQSNPLKPSKAPEPSANQAAVNSGDHERRRKYYASLIAYVQGCGGAVTLSTLVKHYTRMTSRRQRNKNPYGRDPEVLKGIVTEASEMGLVTCQRDAESGKMWVELVTGKAKPNRRKDTA